MSLARPGTIEGILDELKTYPSSDRLRLARMILETLEAPAIAEPPRRSLNDIVGLLKTDAPPPTDEECRRIVEEERWKKYGS